MAGNKLADVPLSGLLTFQQVIEFGSKEITGVFYKALDSFNEKKLPTDFFNKLENDLEKKLRRNNEISDEIGAEILRRMKTIYKDVTTPESMEPYKRKITKALKDFENLYTKLDIESDDKKEVPVIKPVFAASREKKL